MFHSDRCSADNVRSFSETLDQHFGEDSYLASGMLAWWPDDKYTRRTYRVPGHDWNKRARGQMLMDEALGEISDAESCYGGSDQSSAVVGFEAPLRSNRDGLFTIHELPGFSALHESLMREEFIRCLRRSVRFDILRTRN